jgi:hypothetical protein
MMGLERRGRCLPGRRVRSGSHVVSMCKIYQSKPNTVALGISNKKQQDKNIMEIFFEYLLILMIGRYSQVPFRTSIVAY